MSREFVAFVAAGGSAALVNWLSRIAFSAFTSLEMAVALAYLVGMTTAFILNRVFVFGRSGRTIANEYSRFALVNVIALVQVFAITLALGRWFFPAIGFDWHPHEVAHAVGVAAPIVTSYFGHRYFTFSKVDHG